jgi:hypothetical protein
MLVGAATPLLERHEPLNVPTAKVNKSQAFHKRKRSTLRTNTVNIDFDEKPSLDLGQMVETIGVQSPHKPRLESVH